MREFEFANHMTELLLEGHDTAQIEHLLNIPFMNIWEEVYELVLKGMKEFQTAFFASDIRQVRSDHFELQLYNLDGNEVAFNLKFILSNIIYQIGSEGVAAKLTLTPNNNITHTLTK